MAEIVGVISTALRTVNFARASIRAIALSSAQQDDELLHETLLECDIQLRWWNDQIDGIPGMSDQKDLLLQGLRPLYDELLTLISDTLSLYPSSRVRSITHVFLNWRRRARAKSMITRMETLTNQVTGVMRL